MSSKANKETWICPLCVNNILEYGKSCENLANCGGVFNVNAKFYVDIIARKRLEKIGVTRGVGISEIANKEE